VSARPDAFHWTRYQEARDRTSMDRVRAAESSDGKARPRRGGPPFPVGARIRYGEAGVVHVVVAVRQAESDAQAPSGNVSTVVQRTAHLWQEVTP